jgi:hypothetical protein
MIKTIIALIRLNISRANNPLLYISNSPSPLAKIAYCIFKENISANLCF